MFINPESEIVYDGQKQAGDREATQAEIDAYNNDPAKLQAQKWAIIETARQTLTVEFNGTTFAANKEAVIALKNAIDSMGDSDTKNWVEDKPILMTKMQLETVFILANDAYQALIDAQFPIKG